MSISRITATLLAAAIFSASPHRAVAHCQDHPQSASDQSSSESKQEKVKVPNPLGDFILIHDGEYDPKTMYLFDELGIDGVTYITQGDDPTAEETGSIDIDLMIQKLRTRNPDGIQGWLEIDFESPFVPILRDSDTDPRFEETHALMQTFVTRVRTAFPDALVTIYNVPSLPYWIEQSDGSVTSWETITVEQRATALARLENLKPLLDQMDWFLPRFYDIRPTWLIPEERREKVVAAEIEYRKAHVEWLRAYVDASDRPHRKIIPVVRTRLVAGASQFAKYVGTQVPIEEFLTEQVHPAIDSGADGVFIWGGGDNYAIHIAFTPPDRWPEDVLQKTHQRFRNLGALGPTEKLHWQSPSQKQKFQAALGRAESPYVAATVRILRASTPPSARKDVQVEPPAEKEAKSATPP